MKELTKNKRLKRDVVESVKLLKAANNIGDKFKNSCRKKGCTFEIPCEDCREWWSKWAQVWSNIRDYLKSKSYLR